MREAARYMAVQIAPWVLLFLICAAADDRCSVHAGVDGHTVGCSGFAP